MAQKSSDRGVGASTASYQGLKWLKNAFAYIILAKFLQQKLKFPMTWGATCFQQPRGLQVPLALPLGAHSLDTVNFVCHKFPPSIREGGCRSLALPLVPIAPVCILCSARGRSSPRHFDRFQPQPRHNLQLHNL